MKPLELYELLFEKFGPQGWWPVSGKYYPRARFPKTSRERFEVLCGAILTQNVSWKNAEKAIANLKRAGLLSPKKLASCPLPELRRLVKPVRYYNQKAVYLKQLSLYLVKHYGGDLNRFFSQPTCALKHELMAWKGVGPETRDSILLYAAGKPVFVVDAYTVRVSKRLGLTSRKGYAELQEFFESALPRNAKLYNEFHALLVELGKNYCLKTKPKCGQCPLTRACPKKGVKP